MEHGDEGGHEEIPSRHPLAALSLGALLTFVSGRVRRGARVAERSAGPVASNQSSRTVPGSARCSRPRPYPAHQGRVLFDAVTGHFNGDPDAACHYLIDQHPAGWSVLHGDFTAPPGYRTGHNPQDLRNQCYCHGDRHEPPRPPLTERTARDAFIDYAYVLEPERLRVLTNRAGGWQPVAEPAWTDTPDWGAIDLHAQHLRRGWWPHHRPDRRSATLADPCPTGPGAARRPPAGTAGGRSPPTGARRVGKEGEEAAQRDGGGRLDDHPAGWQIATPS